MRVFMLGWEFPPFISGGLGTACYGLTKAMSGLGTEILFVLPRPVTSPFSTHVKLLSPRADSPLASPVTEFRLDEFEHVSFRAISSKMGDPYARPERHTAADRSRGIKGAVGPEEEATIAPSPNAGFVDAPAKASTSGDHYGGDMFGEIQRYASLATEIARQEQFDVVHAHDWMTSPADLAISADKAVPLVVHVHSTEFDHSGVN